MNDFLYKYGKPGVHFSFKSMEEDSDWTENKNIPTEFLTKKLKDKTTDGYESYKLLTHPSLGREHVDGILDRVLHYNAQTSDAQRFFGHASDHGLLGDAHIDRILKSPRKNILINTTANVLKPHHLDDLVKTVPDVQLSDMADQNNLQPHHIDHILDRISKFPDSGGGDYARQQTIARLVLGNHNLAPNHVSMMRKIGNPSAIRYLDRKYPQNENT